MASPEPSTYITPSPSSGPFPPKPTLLAFHGSGSNATIHTIQLARLARLLKPYLAIHSLDAPFPSPPGPGILPFFDGCGPYKRWLPLTEKVSVEAMQNGTSTAELGSEVEDVVRAAVAQVRGAGGQVVGLIGFSQGTKVVAGLLHGTQIRRKYKIAEEDWCEFRFGVCVCPSFPPPLVPRSVLALLSEEQRDKVRGEKIQAPSFLVLGKQDEWHWAGKSMAERHFETGTGSTEVAEWDIGHHYPVAPEESERIKDWILALLGDVSTGEEEEEVAR
ncbi:hypothetical protein ACN47E_001806 [Coniothyrium glycines]